MLKYTLCFIKYGNKILLLNREKPGWMGSWNGVGGRIEPNETPFECVVREVREETGIQLNEVDYTGIVTWQEDGNAGGMYVFIAEVNDGYLFDSPIKTDEGILDWKELDWVLSPKNTGIVSNIQRFLPRMLNAEELKEYHCVYEQGVLRDFIIWPLES